MIPTNLPIPVEVWTFDDRRLRAGKGLLKLTGLKWAKNTHSGFAISRGRAFFAVNLYATEEEAKLAARARIWQLESQVRNEYHTRMTKLGRSALNLAGTTIPETGNGA